MNQYYIKEVDKIKNSVYTFHGEMGESLIPTHSHQKGQFLYTEGGIVFVKVNQQNYFLPSRHFMWIAPGMEHSIHPSSEKVIMRNIYFPIDDADDPFYFKTAIYPVNDLILHLLIYSEQWKGDIGLREPDEYTIASAFKILITKLNSYDLPLALPYPKDEKLVAIINYLSLHINQKLTLPLLSKEFNISIRSLTRLFSQDLNMTFVEYLTILKLLKSLELLLESNLSIKEICNQVGYNSVPTFSNTFNKILGIRPMEYRKIKKVL